MLVVGEGVDGRDSGKLSEIDDVLLCVRADDGAMEHSAHDAGGIANGFAAAELDIGCGEEHDIPAEFANADLERDAGAGGGFAKDECPALAGERFFVVVAAGGFHDLSELEDLINLVSVHGFDGEEVSHGISGGEAFPVVLGGLMPRTDGV